MEETDVNEIKERLEEIGERQAGWTRYLAVTTALIAVVAAIASLQSGALSDAALLAKDEAVLAATQASAKWGYYQAKSLKVHLLEAAAPSAERDAAIGRYEADKQRIGAEAERLGHDVEESNRRSAELFERHHGLALSVTLFQIAIALSAMSALLGRRSFWALSLLLAIAGLGRLAIGLLG